MVHLVHLMFLLISFIEMIRFRTSKEQHVNKSELFRMTNSISLVYSGILVTLHRVTARQFCLLSKSQSFQILWQQLWFSSCGHITGDFHDVNPSTLSQPHPTVCCDDLHMTQRRQSDIGHSQTVRQFRDDLEMILAMIQRS